MLFTIPYASVLLASFSCIWATPIAVNRDTLIQRRSEPGLSSRATEIASVEARGLGFNSLSAWGDVHAIHRRAQLKVKEFAFLTWVLPTNTQMWTRYREKGYVWNHVDNLLKKAREAGVLPHEVILPTYQTVAKSWDAYFKRDGVSRTVSEMIVHFEFKLSNDPNTKYIGVLSNPVGDIVREEEDFRTPENHGMLYKERSVATPGQPQRQEFNRIFPALPNSVMPGGTLAVLNPRYNPIYTGHWIRDFIFHQKVMLDYGDKKKQAKEIARLAQMLLARALPKVEVFDITGVMYDPEVYGFHPPHPAIEMTPGTKDVSFAFRLKEATAEGGISDVEYTGKLDNPPFKENLLPDGAVPKGALYREGQLVYPNPPIAEGTMHEAGLPPNIGVKRPNDGDGSPHRNVKRPKAESPPPGVDRQRQGGESSRGGVKPEPRQ